jgi:hypothetical protein
LASGATYVGVGCSMIVRDATCMGVGCIMPVRGVGLGCSMLVHDTTCVGGVQMRVRDATCMGVECSMLVRDAAYLFAWCVAVVFAHAAWPYRRERATLPRCTAPSAAASIDVVGAEH